MRALNFLILGAPGLCFDSSPTSAHLRGRAGSLCPHVLTAPGAISHCCEPTEGLAQPDGGAAEPFTSPCPNKTLLEDKDLPLTSLWAPEAVTWGLTRVPLTLQRAGQPSHSPIPSPAHMAPKGHKERRPELPTQPSTIPQDRMGLTGLGWARARLPGSGGVEHKQESWRGPSPSQLGQERDTLSPARGLSYKGGGTMLEVRAEPPPGCPP